MRLPTCMYMPTHLRTVGEFNSWSGNGQAQKTVARFGESRHALARVMTRAYSSLAAGYWPIAPASLATDSIYTGFTIVAIPSALTTVIEITGSIDGFAIAIGCAWL